MWIQREISKIWSAEEGQPVRILIGPRQSGKSSFLLHEGGENTTVLTLDDLSIREQAQQGPRSLLDRIASRAIIDEAQYAPNLFPEIKRRVDEFKYAKRSGKSPREQLRIWLSGSNRVLLDKNVSESLAGRAEYYRFNTLSVWELQNAGIETSLENLLMKGGWPELYAEKNINTVRFLNDHIQTSLEKELVSTAGIQKVNEFLRVIRLLSGRVGNMFVASEIGKDAGVKSETVSDWLSLVERMMYLIVVPAYANSLNKRLIKSPKYYFSDVAIATRLQGWTLADPLVVSPNIGFLFENLVASEIVKVRDANAKDWQLFHWRNKEKEEIDFIVSDGIKKIAIECKLSEREAQLFHAPDSFSVHEKMPLITVFFSPYITKQSKKSCVPLPGLRNFLLEFFS